MQDRSLELTPDIEPNDMTSPLLTLNTTKTHKPILQITQYKNATYYGKYDHPKLPHGIGIVMYDSGDILIGEFSGGSLRGCFMHFMAGAEEEVSWWIYGMYWEEKMDGWGYVYGRDHRAVRVLFQEGSVIKDVRYQDGFNTGLHNTYKLPKKNLNFSNLSTPKINIIPPSSPSSNQPQFLKPTDFLQTNLTQNHSQNSQSSEIVLPQSSSQKIETQFKLFQIGTNQMFYGTIENNKPHGIGIIFVDEWPVCYGNFVNGQLDGLGRVQQNRLMVLDGIFQRSNLKVGWVLDLKEKLTCFGTLIQDSPKNKLFKLSQQHTNIQMSKIIAFRRRQHLLSLTYANSYIFEILKKIRSQFLPSHFQNNPQQSHFSVQKQQNFIPSFISQISRVHNQNTVKSRGSMKEKQHGDGDGSSRVERDLIQLIKQYNQNRTNYEKTSRTLSVKLKQSQKMQQISQNYTKQNHVITYIPTKSPQHRNRSKSINKDKIQFASVKADKKMMKNGSIRNINKITSDANTYTKTKENKNRPKVEQIVKGRQQGDRKIEKRLNLDRMYSKYLRRQE